MTSGKPKPNVVFDWTEIHSDGHAFQSMALQLFGDKYEEGFTPGPLHAGPDGAWDGQYDGKLADYTGTWKIACAAYKDFNSLKRKVEDENKAARGDEADALLLMTSLDLTAPQVRELENLAGKGLKKGRIWARAKLNRMIGHNPWVAATHFNVRFVAGFAPPDEPEFIWGQPDVELHGRDTELGIVDDLLRGSERVLIVSGPGGCGKSRLVREISSLAKKVPRTKRPSTWVRRNGAGSIDDALKSALPKGRPLVLCLDDAGQELEDALELVRLATQPRGNFEVKTVLVCRTADLFRLEDVCTNKAGAPFVSLPLGPVGDAAARAIVAEDAPDLGDEVVELLIRDFGRNLYLLRAATRLLVDGELPSQVLEQGHLRAQLAGRFIAECESELATLPQGQHTRRLLLDAALETPLTEQRVGSEPALKTLVEAGLLRRVGRRYRFRHDVEGDLVLRQLCRESWAKVCVAEFLDARETARDNALRNLASAGGEDAGEILLAVCSDWVAKVPTTVGSERLARLKVARYLVRYAPDEVVALCRRFMEIAAPPSTDWLAVRFGEHPPTTDDYGPVIVALAHHGGVESALDLLLLACRSNVPTGTFDNYKIRGAVSESLNPAYSSSEALERAISWLSRSLAEPGDEAHKAEIMSAALRDLLSWSFQWRTRNGRSIRMHEKSFDPTEAVLRIRDAAVRRLSEWLGHPSRSIRLASARVFNGLGWGHPGRVSTEVMKPRVAEEVARILPFVESRLQDETDPEVLHELHHGLVERWAAGVAGADESGLIVRRSEKPLLMRAFGLSEAPWDWVPDVVARMDRAPVEERWSWWLEARRPGLDDDAVGRLLAELTERYPGADGLITVASSIQAAKRPDIILDRWCRTDADSFDEAISKLPEGSVRELLEQVRERVTVRDDATAALARIEELLESSDLDGVQRVVETLFGVPTESMRSVVNVLVRHELVAVRRLGLWLVSHHRDLTAHQVASYVSTALRDGDWSRSWNEVWSCLQHDELKATLGEHVELVGRCRRAAAESLGTEERRWDNDWWYLTKTVELLETTAPGTLLGIVEETLAADSVDGVAHLVGGLLGDEGGLAQLVEVCVRCIDNGQLSGAQAVADFIEAALVESEYNLKYERASLPAAALQIGIDALTSGTSSRRAVGLAVLSELRHSPEACCRIAEIATSDDELKEDALSLLSRFSRPRGVYNGGGVGQAPPALLAADRVLEHAEKLATQAARALLSRLRAGVKQSIQSDLDHDDEVMNPRW